MQVTFSSLLVWITILSSSYWYHSPKMKELVQFRDAIIDSCVLYANDLESCMYNLQRQLFNKKKARSHLSFNKLSRSYHNRSIQCSYFYKGHNSSHSLPFIYSKSSHQSMTDTSKRYLTEEKAFLIAGNYEKLSKQQLDSNELIQSLSARIEDYETELRAMKTYMEILHKSLDYAIGNMTQQSGNLDKLAVKDSSIEAQMRFIQDAVKMSQLHLRHSIHMQKNSSEWLKASLNNLTHSEQKIIDLYQHLFQLQIKEEQSRTEPFNFDEFKLLFYLLALGELLLFFLLVCMFCRRSNVADINDNIKTTFTLSPRNGFECKPNQISSETILDEIRQRQLGDFVCSLSFTNRNQLHQELTAQIQREIPDLQVEYFRVEYLNDIPSLPWAKTFLIFFDLKQKNGIDPIKGTDDIKLIVVKAVQRMGADIFMIFTGDENSCQLQNSEALYHRSLKFLKTYHDIARLMSCKRVISLKDSLFQHQLNHITNAISVWHESLY